MDSSDIITASNVDLSNCDREQIQFSGAILPHGALIALVEPELRIVQVSENTGELLGRAPNLLLNERIESLLDDPTMKVLRQRLHADDLRGPPVRAAVGNVNGRRFHLLAHRCDGVVILEFEPAILVETSPIELYADLRQSTLKLQTTTTLSEFLDDAVSQIRAVTGFDRVMAYKFLEDGSGKVIAESVVAEQIPYLGLHYPASDIPAPARRLFSLTWLRHQPDISYIPVALTPTNNPITGAPLDLSHAVLRSVSVMYTGYLKNMGTTSSMVMTVMKDGDLWGLIACHHHSGPKHVAFEIRLVCEFLANMVSLLISEKEEREYADYRLKLKTTQGQLLERMLQEDDVVGVLTKGQPNLLDFVDAQGAVVMVNDEITALGETPPPDLIRQLAEALAPHSHEGVFATDSVAKQLLPQASAFKDVASGLLALRFSASKNDYLMWFRPEVLRTVNWSGDPRKPVDTSDDGQRLLPRTSFALWRETVRLKSKPWSEMELRVTREFRVAILELVLRRAEKLGELYDKLATSYLELDSFTYVASHDLKEPLRGIHNYARFLLEDCVGYLQKEDVAKLHAIVRLSRRMEGLLDSLLHYSRMSRRELETTACDVNVVVQDVLEMLQARTQESGAKVTVVGHLPEKANADAFILSEIFCNLVVNAMKYNDKPEKQVEIGCLEENGNSTFFVRDNGIGIEPEHFDEIFVMFKRLHALQEFGGGTGAGLTIARKLVQRSGGRIWLESVPGAGSTFYFSLEKDRQERGCT